MSEHKIESKTKDQLRSIDPEVNHPKHYNDHPSGIECIDLTEEFNFNFGCAIKYLWRAGKKDSKTYDVDVRKAKFYLFREYARLEKTGRFNITDSLNTLSAYKMAKNIGELQILYCEKIISSDPHSLLSKVLKSVVDNEDPRVHFIDLNL